jgi:hypothetical protein
MKPTLYLHIGHSKVASTSIQDFLEANLDALRDRGYVVADLEFQFPTTGSQAANPVGELERLKAMGEAGAHEVAKRMRTLHAELTAKGSRFDKAVISAENLCNPGFAELFASTLELFDVKLVYYIRRQDEWLISAWKQWGVKAGKSLDEFCLEGTATRYPAFTVCLKRWEKFAASVHLKPLHKSALSEGSVTKDFARAIAMPAHGLHHPGIRNASFDASVLEVLRFSPHLFQHRDDDRMFRFLESFLSKEIEPMRSILTHETKQRLFHYFESENRSLHGRFFPEADFDAVFGIGSAEKQDAPPTSPELMVRFLGLQLRGLMDLQQRVDELEKQLAHKNQPSLR